MILEQVKEQQVIIFLSTTLLNKYLYHRQERTEESYKQLVESLTGVFRDNIFTATGSLFEKLVFDKSQEDVYKLIPKEDYIYQYKQVKDLEINDKLKVRFTGYLDAISKDKKHIKDIKRVGIAKEGIDILDKYSDESTIQHNIYLYLIPEAETFEYIICEAETKIIGDIYNTPKDLVLENAQRKPKIHTLEYDRPDDDSLEAYLRSLILEYFYFLIEHNLDKKLLEKRLRVE